MHAPHTPSPRILLVGGGSVGQVYGQHFQKGGAEVRFLVRPKYVESCKQGFVMHDVQYRGISTDRFVPDGVFSDPEAATQGGVDAVVLCMSFAGLKGQWLDDLLPHLGEASVLSLVPGIAAKEWLLQKVPAERLLTGMITILAYPGPLKSQQFEPGTAYWFPPCSHTPISGPATRTVPLVSCLNAGGQPAKVGREGSAQSSAMVGMFMPIIAALEAADWSFSTLSRRPHVTRACEASLEALAIISHKLGIPQPKARHIMRPLVLRIALSLARLGTPVNLEEFLKLHFTKVGAQTRLFLDGWVHVAQQAQLPAPQLNALLQDIQQDVADDAKTS